MTFEIKQMWPDGPFRRFALTAPSRSWMAYETGGYVGSYVCASCQTQALGVYRTPDGWICGSCRTNAPRKPESGKKGHSHD